MKWFIGILIFILTSIGVLSGQNSSNIDDKRNSTVNPIAEKENLIRQRNRLIKRGFIFSSIDSPYIVRDSIHRWQLESYEQVDSLFLEVVFKNEQSQSFHIKERTLLALQKKMDELLNSEIQNGYLKTSYQFDTLVIQENIAKVRYFLNLGEKFRIDSVVIHSTSSSMNIQFINNYIRRYFISKQQFDWKEIATQLKYFDFLEMEKSPDFTILDSTAIFNLYLRERKLNQVNAILGILSNAYNSNEVELTGDVKLAFVNLFKQGISFDLNWQKNLSNSQFLFTKFNLPFLLDTKLGIGGALSIEKFDTSYLRVQYQVGLNYHIKYNETISFYYRKNNSIIVGINKQEVLNKKLPSHLDFSTDEFGLGYKVVKLDQPFFTKRGWSVDGNFLAGRKSTYINSKITEIKDPTGLSMAMLYDSIPLSQLTLSFSLEAYKYIPLSRSFILRTRFDSRIWVSETITTGEKFYIGGNKMPRGFDDNSFIVPWYVSFSNELQYYLSDYFYSNIFVDMASMKSILSNNLIYPIGIGGGLSFKTKDNIFRINLGSGYLGESTFSLNSMKVHINYTSVF
jgi:dimeric dUTPase (all-alpha-NTP-PPase superfamily)